MVVICMNKIIASQIIFKVRSRWVVQTKLLFMLALPVDICLFFSLSGRKTEWTLHCCSEVRCSWLALKHITVCEVLLWCFSTGLWTHVKTQCSSAPDMAESEKCCWNETLKGIKCDTSNNTDSFLTEWDLCDWPVDELPRFYKYCLMCEILPLHNTNAGYLCVNL